MEYMILPDGTVSEFPITASIDEVHSLLRMHGGVGFYWNSLARVWGFVEPDKKAITISESQLPDVLKLYLMLSN